jgi:hypothetical protein
VSGPLSFSPCLRADSARWNQWELLYIRSASSIRHLRKELMAATVSASQPYDQEAVDRLDRWERVRDSLTRLMGLSSGVAHV